VKEGSKATWHTTVQITSKGREQSNLTYNLQTDCSLTVVGREHSDLTHNSAYYQWRKGAKQPDVQFTNWLWPYCCRKGAQRPDAQQCKLPVKEGSTATWRTTVQTTSEGREHSNLTYNISHCVTDRCWKGAKRSDSQHYLQLHRPLLEGSKATWCTTLSAAAQTVVGRERSGLTSTQT